MILYSAKYRLPGEWWWTRVRKIKGDLIDNGKQVLIMADERQVHLPLSAVVVFDRRRYLSIREQVEMESGGVARVSGGGAG